VVEVGEEVSLAPEPREALAIRHDLRGQELDRHFPPQLPVPGSIDLAHAPRAEPGGDVVVE